MVANFISLMMTNLNISAVGVITRFQLKSTYTFTLSVFRFFRVFIVLILFKNSYKVINFFSNFLFNVINYMIFNIFSLVKF